MAIPQSYCRLSHKVLGKSTTREQIQYEYRFEFSVREVIEESASDQTDFMDFL
jgi:hypothetical protein